MNVQPRIKVWLEDGRGRYLLGPGAARLLAAVDEHGNLKQAAKRTGYSYRAAWNRLKRIEAALGDRIISASAGGAGGGRSRLTRVGSDLLAMFRELEERSRRLLDEPEKRA